MHPDTTKGPDQAIRPGQNPVGRRVGLYAGFTALDAVGPYEVLNRLPGVTVTTVAERAGRIRTDTGELAMVAERSLDSVTKAEVLLVPGGGERGTTTTTANRVVLDWIRHIHQRSVWTTSVCTGAPRSAHRHRCRRTRPRGRRVVVQEPTQCRVRLTP
ncbi:DJ-1/PfpI family protein [Streptomyces sp. 2A115]|uniref:DJ-1/PfpI family protein n=1 Tax=Streptomyces sp. 2A115 TaxID=3457439 RepID=UPI003FD5CF15